MKVFLIVVALVVGGSGYAVANDYYVATNGNDSAAGTIDQPWGTIQKAANTLAPGDTAWVRGGIYREVVTVNVSGSAAGGYVTFRSYPGETAVVDGSTLPVTDSGYDASPLLLLANNSYVSIQGFEVRNYQTNSKALTPAGIFITGPSHDITLLANRVHDIVNTNKSGNGFGIAIYGTSASQPISNLVLQGNEVFRLQTGESESFTLNGNVINFDVSGNMVHDNNNIGIDFIGYEGTCSDSNQDYARNGVCLSNVVWNISAISNSSDKSYDADGLYCDGCSNVLFELNQVHNCDIGVELASEHKGHAAIGCVLRDNLIWQNNSQGISIGGYSTSVGRTEGCQITHNTLYHNDSQLQGYGEFYLQYYTLSNVFTHNILFANTQNLLIGNPFTQNTNTVDWNLYFTSGATNNAQWEWKKVTYTGFAAYQAATTNDAHSIFADPLFGNASQTNFLLTDASPAIDRGDPGFVAAAGERDIDDDPRVYGSRTDIGADEHTPMDDWRMSKFTGAELLEAAVSGNLATPAGDGICNLLKYALALEPKSNETAVLPSPALADGFLTLTYSRAIAATDLTCVAEAAAMIGGTWTSNADEVVQNIVATNGTAYTIQASDTTGTNQFMRVHVTRP
ncbi:MAG TPA: DUF5123 domain-containing protein [Verrucomicrobiae bacterium]|nr:DUF5123 domain-containing protein [Verrucomicrobiae bacterium]